MAVKLQTRSDWWRYLLFKYRLGDFHNGYRVKQIKKDIVYRNGTQVHDLIVVSGDLGAAYLGLQVLKRENEVFKVNPHMQPDLTGYE